MHYNYHAHNDVITNNVHFPILEMIGWYIV